MLVNEQKAKNWFKKDHPYYKDFAYLFSNPLWDKKVPSAFSLCPFFWFAMFSRLIFRPLFVAPITKIIWPTIKLGGTPFAKLDRKLGEFFAPVFSGHIFFGSGLLGGTLSIMILFAVGVLLVLLGEIFIDAFSFMVLFDGSLIFFWGFVLASINVAVGIIRYFMDKDPHIKPMLCATFVLTMIGMLFYSPESYVDAWGFFVSFVGGAFGYGGDFISWVLGGIWIGIKFVGSVIALIFTLGVFGIVWWAWVLGLLALGAAAMKLFPENYKEHKLTEEEILRDKWERILSPLKMRNFHYWFTLEEMLKNYKPKQDYPVKVMGQAERLWRQKHVARIQEEYRNEIIDTLVANKVSVDTLEEFMQDYEFKDITKFNSMYCDWINREKYKNGDQIGCAIQKLINYELAAARLGDAIFSSSSFQKEFESSAKLFMSSYEKRRSRNQYFENAYEMFNNFFDGWIWKPFCKLVDMTWNGLIKAYRFSGDIIEAVWILVKSNKEKVCPYWRFEDEKPVDKNKS